MAINQDMAELRQTELFELKEQAKQAGQDLSAETAKHKAIQGDHHSL